MQFVEQEIQQLATSIWESILSLPLEPSSDGLAEGARVMAACVQITGAWQGAVTLTCGSELASRAADIMFALHGAAPAPCDLQDAMGELANMVGGNIKALLPEPCHLSLPSVVDGADYSVRVPKSRVLTRVTMACLGSPLDITLIQKIPKAA